MIARTKVGAMLQDPVQRDRMTRGLGKARNPPATQDVLLVPAKAREASSIGIRILSWRRRGHMRRTTGGCRDVET